MQRSKSTETQGFIGNQRIREKQNIKEREQWKTNQEDSR